MFTIPKPSVFDIITGVIIDIDCKATLWPDGCNDFLMELWLSLLLSTNSPKTALLKILYSMNLYTKLYFQYF
ncbi:hypothetical protein CM15mP35_00810 [bacterium]|nr:MAG: hypothetical protein CM15mP35_00810 [bacterium]